MTIIGKIFGKIDTKVMEGGKLLSSTTIEMGYSGSQVTVLLAVHAWDEKARLLRSIGSGNTCVVECQTRIKDYQDVSGEHRRSLELVAKDIHTIGTGKVMPPSQKAEYLGLVTADPMRKGTRLGFSVAVTDLENIEETQYIDCVVEEPLATAAEDNVYKGMQVLVRGQYEIQSSQKIRDEIVLVLDQDGITAASNTTQRVRTESTVARDQSPTSTTSVALTKERHLTEQKTESEPDWVVSSEGESPVQRSSQEETVNVTKVESSERNKPTKVANEKVYKMDVAVDFLSPDAEIPF